jgi:putative ABC transport system permease protein
MTDLGAAFRALVSARGFTAVAVLTLTMGMALAGAILVVLNAYVVRALPYPAADRLYRVDYAGPNQPPPRGMERLDWASLGDVIELPIAWDLDVFYLLGHEYPEAMPGAWVTPGYLTGLGVRVRLGRTFDAADYDTGSPVVALISHRLWQSRFGGDPGVIGRTFNAYVSDRPDEPEIFTIVGVLVADMWHLNVYTEVLTPLKAPSYPYQVRLRAGIAAVTAEQRIDQFVRTGVTSLPPNYRVVLTSLQDSYVTTLRPVLWSVVAAAALVLLIATANVAVLMIVRARSRERELAVRLALGATHARVARLLALEGVLIGTLSTVLATVVASAVMPVVAPLIERTLDRRVPGGLQALTIDVRVLIALLLCGVVVTLVFTCLPLGMVWRSEVTAGLTGAGRSTTAGTRAGRSRAVLIAVEVAASLTLVIGAALMTESALRMLRLNFGIDGEQVVTASLALRQRSFPDESSRVAFFTQLENELRGVAGSSSIAFGDWWPLQGSRPRRVETGGSPVVVATANPVAVSPEYFATLGIALREGRTFTQQDRLGSEAVILVSESLAQRMWPDGRAIGQPLVLHPDGDGQPLAARVVGVVGDVRQSHTDPDLFDAYLPLAQHAGRFAFLYARTPRSPTWASDLRAAVARVNPEVALGAPRALAAGLEQERARPRFLAWLLATFAAFACVLALVGMHGVIAYAVRQRQREIAVRIAVGADTRAVMSMFFRYGTAVLGAGLVVGLAGALALGRVLQSQLFGVRAAEPRVLMLAVAVFGTIALAAIVWPARRAAATDAAMVLKEP